MKIQSEIKIILASIVAIVLSALVLAAVGAGAVLWGWIPEETLAAAGAVVTFLATTVGGAVVGVSEVRGALPKAMGAACGYLLLVFILRGLVFGAVGENGYIPVIAALLGVVFGVFLSVGRKKKRRRR